MEGGRGWPLDLTAAQDVLSCSLEAWTSADSFRLQCSHTAFKLWISVCVKFWGKKEQKGVQKTTFWGSFSLSEHVLLLSLCRSNAGRLVRYAFKWRLQLFLEGRSIELSGIYNSSNGCNQTGSRRFLMGGLQLAFILGKKKKKTTDRIVYRSPGSICQQAP